MATEVVFLKLKRGYTSDQVNQSLKFFRPPPPGFQSLCGGPIIDEPLTIVWLLNWDTVEIHQEYTVSPIYPAFIDTYKTYSTGIEFFHTYLNPFPSSSLLEEAGTLKVSLLAANTGTAGDGSPIGVEVTKLINEILKAPGYHSHHYGIKHEDSSVCTLIEGWDSIEAHDAAHSSETIKKIMRNLEDLSDAEKSSSQFVKLQPEPLKGL